MWQFHGGDTQRIRNNPTRVWEYGLSTKMGLLLPRINFITSVIMCKIKSTIRPKTSTAEWISNFIPHFTCDYLSMLGLKLNIVSETGPINFVIAGNKMIRPLN